MRLHEIFHAVKVSSAADKKSFWALCKTAAAGDPGGVPVGLTKIALEVWADAYERGFDPGAGRATREAFAGSFGSAWVVDQEIDKLAAEGHISSDEHARMAGLLAESAVRDLEEMTKRAGAADIMRMPQVRGALAGTALGAGVGAWKDDENRLRGALAGAVPGAIMGGALGHGYSEFGKGKAEALKTELAEAAAKAVETEQKRGRGAKALDALLSYPAGAVDMTSLRPDVINTVASHYAEGHDHLPKELADKLSLEARIRLEKYMKNTLGGQKKKSSYAEKLADIMQGLDQGGQPPMNAQAPQGSLEGGQEGAPASMDPNAQGGEAIGQAPGIEDGSLDGVEKGNKTVDNMIFLAQQVQLPQLAQELDQNREELAQHFAGGNAYLPPELQHHFAQSEHAEAFMKKYKQRFGSVGGGVKKTASYTLKRAFSVTPAGHAQDAADAANRMQATEDNHKAVDEYAKSHGALAFLQQGKNPLKRFIDKIDARRDNYTRTQHLSGRNAYNPLGGVMTPSGMGSDVVPHGPNWGQHGPFVNEPKQAFFGSFTDAGHALDAQRSRNDVREYATRVRNQENYDDANPYASRTSQQRENSRRALEAYARGKADNIRKHEAGKNVYNPFGGMLTPSGLFAEGHQPGTSLRLGGPPPAGPQAAELPAKTASMVGSDAEVFNWRLHH